MYRYEVQNRNRSEFNVNVEGKSINRKFSLEIFTITYRQYRIDRINLIDRLLTLYRFPNSIDFLLQLARDCSTSIANR